MEWDVLELQGTRWWEGIIFLYSITLYGFSSVCQSIIEKLNPETPGTEVFQKQRVHISDRISAYSQLPSGHPYWALIVVALFVFRAEIWWPKKYLCGNKRALTQINSQSGRCCWPSRWDREQWEPAPTTPPNLPWQSQTPSLGQSHCPCHLNSRLLWEANRWVGPVWSLFV